MLIDLQKEQLISLNQATAFLPPGRNGNPVTSSCVFRWVTEGVPTPRGLVRLEAIRMGGRWLTSIPALQRFAAAQTPNFDEPVPPSARSIAAKQRAQQHAEKETQALVN